MDRLFREIRGTFRVKCRDTKKGVILKTEDEKIVSGGLVYLTVYQLFMGYLILFLSKCSIIIIIIYIFNAIIFNNNILPKSPELEPHCNLV